MVVLDGPSLTWETANMPCAGSSRPRACEIAGDRDRDLPAVGSEWLIQDQAFLIQMVQQQPQLPMRTMGSASYSRRRRAMPAVLES